jgi:hypothetical protein
MYDILANEINVIFHLFALCSFLTGNHFTIFFFFCLILSFLDCVDLSFLIYGF